MDFLRRWLVGRDLKRARALEGEGYVEQALAVYESALAMANDAERPVALRHIGACALRLGKLARAREALAVCVKRTPDDADAWLLLGQVQMELRDTIGADEAFHAALQRAPDRIDILHAQTEYYAVKFPRAAFEAGKRVIALVLEKPQEVERLRFPRELPVVFLRNLAMEQRFVDETIAYFDELAGKGNRWIKPVALNHKGILLANTGRLDEAVKAFLDALSADPEFDAAHVNLGLVHARRRDFDAAKASLSVYAKRHPSDAIATYGFGVLAETKPDVPEMLRLYSFFLERMKSNPPAPEFLGRLDVARGWVRHVETVIEHSKKHQEEHHESEGPHES
ncbi:MAG TPA: tetratricopeptide repeat protein [Planctomycetota bacterium]|nr:tetratricopeptide repeat protein [Planctomycetota bacterium]